MPLIYTNVFYLVIFLVVLVAWGLSEGLGPLRWRGKSGEIQKQDQSSSRVWWITYLAGTTCCFLVPIWLRWSISHGELVFVTGLAIVFVGGGVRWWAITTLGHYFTTTLVVAHKHQVVQHGPYKWLRHPSYSGLLLVSLGIGLMMTNWASLLALMAGSLSGLVYRIKVEEHMLLILTKEYKEYMSHTKRLIPFVF